MKFLLLWSHKGHEYHFETDDLDKLGDPLRQIYQNRKDKSNKTSIPRIFHGELMKITVVNKEQDKFQIEDV